MLMFDDSLSTSRPGARVAMVTGAGGAIGAAISARLADEGCEVYLADRDLHSAVAAAEALGGRGHPLGLDVTDPVAIQESVRQILANSGRLDILINNAGIIKTGPLMESTNEDWQEVCRVNLSSVYFCSKAVLPAMLERRYGKIVNITSISAAKGGGLVGNVLYGATKAGVVAFTKGFARELAPHGINVNAVAPGLLETAMTKDKITPALRTGAGLPMGRFATTNDIANAVAFLASDASGYVTGDVLIVDGGALTV